MVRTRAGYAGGTKGSPTYYDMGDHSESVELLYDEKVISYGELLDVFWSGHSPTSRPYSRQYMSIIFSHDENQRRMALESKRRYEQTHGNTVFTEIVPASSFTMAEDYHQKFYLRQDPSLMRELEAMYPDEQDLVDSTAAARINGYLGGYGNEESLKEILPSLGLSDEASRTLLKRVTGPR